MTVKDGSKTIEAVPYGGPIIDDITFYSSKSGDDLKLPDTFLPVLLSVSSSTHMGNGNTYFYAFKQDGTMKELLCAEHTIDREKDSTNGAIFENGRLHISLQTKESEDGYSDIILNGREYTYGATDTDISGKYLYQISDIKRVYSFNEDTLQYNKISDSKEIIQTMDGVISYDDYWKSESKSN